MHIVWITAGLGLAITRRICQMMGSEVSVESTAGEGPTFTMRRGEVQRAVGRTGSRRDLLC